MQEHGKHSEKDWTALCALTDGLVPNYASRREAFDEAVRRNPHLNATPPSHGDVKIYSGTTKPARLAVVISDPAGRAHGTRCLGNWARSSVATGTGSSMGKFFDLLRNCGIFTYVHTAHIYIGRGSEVRRLPPSQVVDAEFQPVVRERGWLEVNLASGPSRREIWGTEAHCASWRAAFQKMRR